MKWGKFMTNFNMNFWQNAYTDMIEKGNKYMQMDTLFDKKLFEDSMSRFKEMSQLVQKFSPMGFFMNPSDAMAYDYKKNMDEILKLIGLISIDEYQSLIKKYEELKKQNQDLEKTHGDQQKKITELNQVATAEKKRAASSTKSIEDNKSQLEEQKKIAVALNKELETQKMHALSLEKELDQLKKLAESLKKDISEKEIVKKKNETTKA
jgi:hypothetical protein